MSTFTIDTVKKTFLLLFSCLLMLPATLLGQEPEETMPEANILHERSVMIKTEEEVLMESATYQLFPNVNKIPFFEDKKALAEIKRLANGNDMQALDQVLEPYIAQFGIQNFKRQVSLLWLAGRVKQILQDTARAKFYYELAYLNNRGNKAPKLAYDSLHAPINSEWLPIDKYYELLDVRKRIDPLVPPKNVLLSMGDKINTHDPEYAPFMHRSDSVLIYTSRRDGSGMRSSDFVDPFASLNEDLYYAQIDFITGEWQKGEKLPDTINSKFNEGSACLSPDGKTLFFTRCRDIRGFPDCDIYQAEFDGVTWTNVRNLGQAVNSTEWDSQPNISRDGKLLFFASNRKGGFGGTDIYFCEKDEEGRWKMAQNAGPIINTPSEEVTPFYHYINNTLYFSSTGQMSSFGSFDIYKSRWIQDRWEHPSNLGPLINTRGNEYYFSIDGGGNTIFYATAKDASKDHVRQDFDLFSFPMPMEARPDAIAKLKGVLVDSVSGHVLQGTVMIIDLENGREIAPKEINEEGYFEFDLKNNNQYRIYVLGDSFLTVKNDFIMKGDTSFQIFTESFEKDQPIVFESMEFKSNSARLLSTVKPKLDYIVRFLQNYPMFKIEIEGHTDSDGAEEANLELSIERANRIREYVLRKGNFDDDKIKATGYGEVRPLVPNDTDENKQKNRRVEFKLTLDELYDGDMWLPTADELFFDDETIEDYDENETFDDGFDMTPEEQKSWDEELEMDDELNLDEELENDLLLNVKKDKTDKKTTPPESGKKTPPTKKKN